MKQCTFQPQIKDINEEPRNANEFYEDQIRFQKLKQERIVRQREERMEIEGSHHSSKPRIDKISKLLGKSKGRDRSPVHERLYRTKSTQNLPARQKSTPALNRT